MPVYLDDVRPIIGRLLEGVDRGRRISFQDVHQAARNGQLRQLIEAAGNYPMPPLLSAEDWNELTEGLAETLGGNEGDEAEHFYVT